VILRKATTFLLIVIFWAGAVGLPVPQIGMSLGDEDFPCRGHNCGCLDAEMCRTNCCCFPEFSAAAKAKTTETHSCCSAKKAKDEPVGCVMKALGCRGVDSLVVHLPPLDYFRELRLFERARRLGVIFHAEDIAHFTDLEPVTPPPRIAA